MSTLTGKKIKDTYDGLVKTSDQQEIPATGRVELEDGLGNTTALKVGREDNGAEVTGDLHASGRLSVNELNPTSRIEVYDNRTDDDSDDYTVNIKTSLPSTIPTPNPGTGGIKATFSQDDGSTFPYGISMVPGTTTCDIMSTQDLAFYSNSDLDTVSATGLRAKMDSSGMEVYGNLDVTGKVSFYYLEDSGENITISKFVDEADGIDNNDNDTSIPTSAAVKNYVDVALTGEDLDFSGDTGTGSVDLDSQTLAITGTGIATTTAANQGLAIDVPATNLSTTSGASSTEIVCTTGSNATISGATQTLSGVMTSTDKTKLDGIETGAEVNQTASEIKTAYESNSNTNAFTDFEKSKLSGIATGAEVNVQANWLETNTASDAFIQNKPTIPTVPVDSVNGQTGAVVLDADDISDASTTNKFATSAEKTKLGHITVTQAVDLDTMESNIATNNAKVSNVTTNLSATANGTSLTVVSSDGTNASIPAATTSAWGAMTDEDKSKLDNIQAGAEANVNADWNATSGDAQILNKPTIPTNNNQLTNGAGYITDGNTGWNNTYGFITASSTDTLTNKSGNISQWTNDAGYTTNVGDITGVTAGNALTGGGTSGSVTINLSTEGPGAGTYGSTADGTKIDNITIDAYGRIQGITTGATGSMSSWTIKEGNGTESTTVTNGETFTIAQGTGIQSEMTSTSSGGTITITNTAPNVTTNLSKSATTSSVTILSSDGTDVTIGEATGSAAGVMSTAHHDKLDGIAAGATNVTNNNQLTNGAGYTTNIGDITAVTAGTNLTGGGTSGSVTLNMATGGIGAGTYGSTSDTTKIDTITVDAYGRVTAVATGAVGGGSTPTLTQVLGAGNTTTTGASFYTNGIIAKDSSNAGAHSDAYIVASNDAYNKPAMYLHGQAYQSTANIEFGQFNTGVRMLSNGTGSYDAFQFVNSSGSTVGYIRVSAFNTTYSTSSDYRLKENIVELTDGIERVKQLKPKRFNFIGSEGTVDGFIAHEAQEVVPEAVVGEKDEMEQYVVTPIVKDDEGNVIEEAVMGERESYQGIDQSKLVPLLTKALQEAISKIEDLEARIITLETT